MVEQNTVRLEVVFARRFFRPRDADWDARFFSFVPWQYESWQRWRRETQEGHVDQHKSLSELSPETLQVVMTNADLLLFLLSSLELNDITLLTLAGQGQAPLSDEFRRRIVRRHHALWLAGRDYSVPESQLLNHPNHKLFEDLSAEKITEHLRFVDSHARLLGWLRTNQLSWYDLFLQTLAAGDQPAAGTLVINPQ